MRWLCIDIFVCFCPLAVMDGVTATKLIAQRQGGHPKARIIFLTAHVSDTFESECLEAGAVGFLSKPCNLQSVDDCIRRTLGD